MSYYRLSTYSRTTTAVATDYVVKGTSPTKALRELAALAGYELAEQDGRYGTAADGTKLMALTEKWGRVDSPDARTTRL